MLSLAERLDALHGENGRPDVEARKVELTKLIQSLPSNELRFLKHQLNSYTFQTDICGKLPPELLLQVCAYLDLEEFMKTRRVSRQWYKSFSEPKVLQSVARTHSLLAPNTFSNTQDQVAQVRSPPSISEWLPQAASKRIQRIHGQYTSVSARECIKVEDDNNAGGVLSETAKQYCGGRVAYNLNDRTIAVTDLRTDVTTTVMDENRIRLNRWHLSDQFLVAITNHSIVAFPLEPQNGGTEPRSVRLPSSVRQFFQYQDQVGVITMGGEVLIWNIGGDLRSLDISIPGHLASFKLKPVGITFHPEDKRNVFIVFTGDNREVFDEHTLSDPVAKIIVQDHKLLDQTSVLFHELDLFRGVKVDSDKDYPNRQFLALEDNFIGIGIIDMVYLNMAEESGDKDYYARVPPALPKPHPCQHNVFSKKAIRPHPSFGCSIENSQCTEVKAFVVVKFNTRLKEFSTQCYHLPNYPGGEMTAYPETHLCQHALFWRNQMVLSYPPTGGYKNRHAIMGLNDCSRPPNDQTSPPNFYGYGRPQFNTSWAPFTWLYYESKNIAERWIRSSWRSPRLFVSNFRGDDEFVVWFLPYGYFVWYFGEDAPNSSTALQETPTPPIQMERIIYDQAVPESDDDEVPIGELAEPLLFRLGSWPNPSSSD